jgi:hypothetical protein
LVIAIDAARLLHQTLIERFGARIAIRRFEFAKCGQRGLRTVLDGHEPAHFGREQVVVAVEPDQLRRRACTAR